MANVRIEDLVQFRNNLAKLRDTDEFLKSCVKELTARLLRLVIKATPVGDYSVIINGKRTNPSGKVGGTLRRGWTHNLDPALYAESIDIRHVGSDYTINITNPVEYAAYVEFGHRTASHTGWVEGRFMMTISEQELSAVTPQILEQKLLKYMKGVFR